MPRLRGRRRRPDWRSALGWDRSNFDNGRAIRESDRAKDMTKPKKGLHRYGCFPGSSRRYIGLLYRTWSF